LKCPKCNQPLRRLTAAVGSFILTCPNRVKIEAKGSEPRSDHCGQKLHVLAIEGIAIVLPLSRAQFEKFQRAYPGAAAIYAAIGVIPTRAGAEYVPSYPCQACKEPTRLYDLHGGNCKKCSGILE
jgi:ssDNA-binding Zn-finger/Zn-ribbon topoisomerase 1